MKWTSKKDWNYTYCYMDQQSDQFFANIGNDFSSINNGRCWSHTCPLGASSSSQSTYFAGTFLDPQQKFRMPAIDVSKDDNIAAGIIYIKEKGMRFVGPLTTMTSHNSESVAGAI